MPAHVPTALSAALAALLLLTACGTSMPTTTTLDQARADTYAAVARRLYNEERAGSSDQSAARVIAVLPRFAQAVQRGDPVAARRALRHQPVRHAVRARLVLGGRVFADVGLPFVVGGEVHPYRSSNPQRVGTIEVSIQDITGYIRLMHRLCGVQMLVRGQSGHVATLLPAAAAIALPAAGYVSISGRRYRVSSFTRRGFAGEPLSVWVLAPV
ncbi:MAG: hypothetical protein ACR2ND_01130 [Solirubrobacteraceae bacterium]